MNTRLDIHISLSTSDCLLSLLSQAFESTAMLSLIKRGKRRILLFWFIAWFVCLDIHLQAASLLAKSSQEPNCSREAWPAETGKKETKHQRSLRGLIELWPHHDLRTRRNETDHYHYLDNLITQILNKFIMLGSCINISC